MMTCTLMKKVESLRRVVISYRKGLKIMDLNGHCILFKLPPGLFIVWMFCAFTSTSSQLHSMQVLCSVHSSVCSMGSSLFSKVHMLSRQQGLIQLTGMWFTLVNVLRLGKNQISMINSSTTVKSVMHISMIGPNTAENVTDVLNYLTITVNGSITVLELRTTRHSLSSLT